MGKKKQTAYWEKMTEQFTKGADAQSRAAQLRTHKHVSHVRVDRDRDAYVVTFSVARWYLNELRQAGGTL